MRYYRHLKNTVTVVILVAVIMIIVAGFYYYLLLAESDGQDQFKVSPLLNVSDRNQRQLKTYVNFDYSSLDNTTATLLIKKLASDILGINITETDLGRSSVSWKNQDANISIPARSVSATWSKDDPDASARHLDLLLYFKNNGYAPDDDILTSLSADYDESHMKKDNIICNLVIKTEQAFAVLELACAELPE